MRRRVDENKQISMKWYEKYIEEIPEEVCDEIKEKLAARQSEHPLVSVVVIAYNEERRLAACLWSLSELQSKYPIEILGVNNNSKDNTEKIYQLSEALR